MSNGNQQLRDAMETLHLVLTGKAAIDDETEEDATNTVTEYIHSRGSDTDPFLPPLIVLDLLQNWTRTGVFRTWWLLSMVLEDVERDENLSRTPGFQRCVKEHYDLIAHLGPVALPPRDE